MNARQAMSETGGKLTIQADSDSNQWIVINVSDTGCGIQADMVDKIFEPFVSTKTQATQPDQKGTGLGLMVCKDIIEKHTGFKIEGHANLHTEYHSVRNEPYQVLHMFSYLYRYPIQDLFNVQVRANTLNYVQSVQFEKNETFDNTAEEFRKVRNKINDLIEEKKPRLVWCGMLTSTKRKILIKKMLHSQYNETLDGTPHTILQLDDISLPAFEWKSMKQVEKEIDQRSKECRDCGSPYELTPFDRGIYEGDNEPIVFVDR